MESWKIDKDLCRCCHSEGSFRQLSDLEGYYCDMLRRTFDIHLKPVEGLLQTQTYTICDGCVLRLRDATSFRRQVLQCESRFQDMFNKGFIILKSPHIKHEEPDLNEFTDDNMDTGDLDGGVDTFDVNDAADCSDSTTTKIEIEVCKEEPESTETKRRSGRKKAVKPPEKAKPKAKPKKTVQSETSGDGEDAAKKDTHQWDRLADFTTLSQDGANAYVCNQCGLSLQTIESIRAHIKSEHVTNLECHVCKNTYKSESRLNKHLASCHGLRVKIENDLDKLICDICQKEFANKTSIRRHVREFHLLRKCPDCPVQLLKKELARHRSNVHGMIMPTCDICGFKTLGPYRMRKHLTAHMTTCTICKKEFSNKKKLAHHHARTHKPHQCPDCPMVLTKDELYRHRAEAHGRSTPTCGVCGYKNRNQYRIDHHQRLVHLKEKNVSCPHCESKFYSRCQLQKHMVKHNPVKKFECSFCKKKFPRSAALSAHEKIHTGDKRKVCGICDARFVQKASLNYHMAKHHPEAS